MKTVTILTITRSGSSLLAVDGLKDKPKEEIMKVINFIKITPTAMQIDEAINLANPELFYKIKNRR